MVGQLFKPQTAPASAKPNPTGSASGSSEGPIGGLATRLGKASKVPDIDDIDAIADPTEREAAKKLLQAVQRIKANRDRRSNPSKGWRGAAGSDTRRDW
jgi:hypothetical protein